MGRLSHPGAGLFGRDFVHGPVGWIMCSVVGDFGIMVIDCQVLMALRKIERQKIDETYDARRLQAYYGNEAHTIAYCRE
jgi:hypothetical protein